MPSKWAPDDYPGDQAREDLAPEAELIPKGQPLPAEETPEFNPADHEPPQMPPPKRSRRPRVAAKDPTSHGDNLPEIQQPRQLPMVERGPGLLTGMMPAPSVSSTTIALQSMYMRQMAMQHAASHPRDPRRARDACLALAKVPYFQDKGTYSFVKGGKTIEGVSVKAAKEMSSMWTNIDFGDYLLQENETHRVRRCFAIDLQSGREKVHDVPIPKRMLKAGNRWENITDERDILAIDGNWTSRAIRNCILDLLPQDLPSLFITAVRRNKLQKIESHPDQFRNWLVEQFAIEGVPLSELEALTNQKTDQWKSAMMLALNEKLSAIQGGEITWRGIVKAAGVKNQMPSAKESPADTAVEMRERLKKHADDRAAQAATKKKEQSSGKQIEASQGETAQGPPGGPVAGEQPPAPVAGQAGGDGPS